VPCMGRVCMGAQGIRMFCEVYGSIAKPGVSCAVARMACRRRFGDRGAAVEASSLCTLASLCYAPRAYQWPQAQGTVWHFFGGALRLDHSPVRRGGLAVGPNARCSQGAVPWGGADLRQTHGSGVRC